MPGRFTGWTVLLAVGAALLAGFVASTLAYRYRLLRVPGEPVVARMDRELHLTPAQRSQIRDIMRNTRLKIMQYERDFRSQRRELFLQAMQQIRATLTPEQQEKFDGEFLPLTMRRGRESKERDRPQHEPSPHPEGGL